MKVKSTVRINTIAVKQLNDAVKKSLEQTAEAFHTEVVQAQVIPRMDGALQGEKFYVDTSRVSQGKVRLVHEGAYARRLYYHPEYNFRTVVWTDSKGRTHDGNPNAKGHWFEDWLPNGTKQDFITDTFKDLLKRNGGL